MFLSMRFVVAAWFAMRVHSEEVCSDSELESSSLLQVPHARQAVHECDAMPNSSQISMLQGDQYGCQGADSRCAGADPRTCVQLVKDGAACGFVYPPGTSYVSIKNCENAVRDIVLDGHTKVCTGNDSRCPGADESSCRALSKEGADCLWIEDHDFFSSGRICYNHNGVVKTCKDLVDDCMKNTAKAHATSVFSSLLATEEDVANHPMLASLKANATSGRRRRRRSVSECQGACILLSTSILSIIIDLIVGFKTGASRNAASYIAGVTATGNSLRRVAGVLVAIPKPWEIAWQLWHVLYGVFHAIGVTGFIKAIARYFSWWAWIVVGIMIAATIAAWVGSAGALAMAEFFKEASAFLNMLSSMTGFGAAAFNVFKYCNTTGASL